MRVLRRCDLERILYQYQCICMYIKDVGSVREALEHNEGIVTVKTASTCSKHILHVVSNSNDWLGPCRKHRPPMAQHTTLPETCISILRLQICLAPPVRKRPETGPYPCS
jgi:hypothetical protein